MLLLSVLPYRSLTKKLCGLLAHSQETKLSTIANRFVTPDLHV